MRLANRRIALGIAAAVAALGAAVAALGAAGAAAAEPTVQIRDAVARVTVIPEDRADVKVEFLTTNRDLPLQVRVSGSETIIDGDLGHRIYDCHTGGDQPSASVRHVGHVDYKDIPQVVIHTPKAVVVESNGAVFGAIGRSASLDVDNSGCSAWTIADVAGAAILRDSGVGSVHMGSAGRLDVHLSGAAEVRANRVGGLDASISGAGGVTINELTGPMQARVSGAAKIHVLQGSAGAVHAAISGAGGIDFGGTATSLDAQISGIGGIRVKQVTGPVTKSVSGIGHVTVG
jgi:hypothetical protein